MSVFEFGTLDLEVNGSRTPVTVTASFNFGTLTTLATGDAPSAALYDEDNVFVCALPLATGIQYSPEVSAEGFVSLRLPLDDAATALCTAKRFLKIMWRGKIRQAARIDQSSFELAVDGRSWRVFDNLPGVGAMLKDLAVWPEYGLDRTSQSTRTFGYMSIYGAWHASGNWTKALGVRYRDGAYLHGGSSKPAGLAYPNPYWIAKRGPGNSEPAGEKQWFRYSWTTHDDEISYQILATADDQLTLSLDGEQLITPDMQQGASWRQLIQLTGTLEAGKHVLAAKVRNARSKTRSNPMSLILTLQQLQKNGDVVLGTPMVNSSPSWIVSDVLPGFRRADVLRQCHVENVAQNVKAAQLIGLAFTYSHDTDGDAWTDAPDQYELPVGDDMLSGSQQMSEKYLDWRIDPDTLAWQAWNRKGSDKSATVKLERGHIRGWTEAPGSPNGSVRSQQINRREAAFNSALIQLADGTWIQVEDAASVAAYGRAMTSVSAGDTSTESGATAIARGLFTENAHPSDAYTLQITSSRGPQPGTDFDEGDSIGVQDETGAWVKVRVMGYRLDASVDRKTGYPIDVEVVRDLT